MADDACIAGVAYPVYAPGLPLLGVCFFLYDGILQIDFKMTEEHWKTYVTDHFK